MSIPRIIAKLDVKPPYVVKPIHFEGLRKIGSPLDLAEKYYNQGADEIMYLDIVASLYQRGIIYEDINNTASKVFIPFAVGGGVKSIDDFSKLFHSGADKVAVNTFALQESPKIIDDAASRFGSQAVVVNIEAKKWESNWECYSDCGRIRSSKDVIDWSKEVEDRGAGEIFIQSVDRDGRNIGFDVELVAQVVQAVNIPVIASSGAGSLEDIMTLNKHCSPSGIAIASLLHYNKYTISEIKKYLQESHE